MNHTLVICQARMESQRYPSKILSSFCGQRMLIFQLARLDQCKYPVMVALPNTPDNVNNVKPLLDRHEYSAAFVNGDPNDVLGRYYHVAAYYQTCADQGYDAIVRVTGDCPLIDPHVINDCVAYFRAGHYDHVGLALEWGDGFDCEVFSLAALENAYHHATLPSEREHVTPYIYHHPDLFRLGTFPCPLDLSWMRCSVDTPEDMEMIDSLARMCLTLRGFHFTWQDIWQVASQYPRYEQYMRRRVHNAAYVAQVAQERQLDDIEAQTLTWQEVRYNLHTGREF